MLLVFLDSLRTTNYKLAVAGDSRALGNTFLLNYGLQFILNGFSYENNYYEQKAFGNYYNFY